MSVIITDEKPDIYLTRSQYSRLLDEYKQAFMFYAGTPPEFEDWYRTRSQRQEFTTTNVTLP